MICGLCGDPLVKKTLVNSRQIIGLVAALAFTAPLFIMITFIIKDFTNETLPKKTESIVLITIENNEK